MSKIKNLDHDDDSDDDDEWTEELDPVEFPFVADGLGEASGHAHDFDQQARGPKRRSVLRILHHDPDLIIVDKPPGMPLQPADEADPSIVEALLAAAIPHAAGPLFDIPPVDPEISGLHLLACSESARDHLRAQLSANQLNILIQAIVQGPLVADRGIIDRPILDRGRGADRVRIGSDEKSAPAITEWKLTDSYIAYALIEAVPRTLIRHQLRAHFESAGFPLAVDLIYGGAPALRLSAFKAGYRRSRRRQERPLIERPTLHIRRIEFTHPSTGSNMSFDALTPKDFRAALHQLNRFGRITKNP